MKTPIKALLLLSALLTLSRSSQAEIIVTMDHNDGASNTEAFRFQTVPSPRPSAALDAVFKVVDGAPYANSASLNVLHDGLLPSAENQPEANFFFQDDSDGGRLLVDLGKVIPVKEVDTYSWHPSTRGPQVYKLYGSDGGGAGFEAEPKRPQDPVKSGWKLLATVDTRTRFAQSGGQYGVKVADTEGLLGSYRYLLFDVMRTEDVDTLGNTFFSEIDVAGAAWMGGAVTSASKALQVQLSLEPGSGLTLTDVIADSPAAKAGLQVNDVLTRFNDQLLVDPTQLVSLTQTQRVGDTVRVAYVRRSKPEVTEVTMGLAPSVPHGNPWMGFAVESVSDLVRAQLSLEPGSGLAVSSIVVDGPAAKAGLQRNDVLTRIDDQLLVDPAKFSALIHGRRVGDTMRLSYVRRSQPGTVEVVLGTDKRLASNQAALVQNKVTVTIDHNESAAATGAFQFKTVPSPWPSAISSATLQIEGVPDDNSAAVNALQDGHLPDKEDQPDANFFFKNGSPGGRLTIDLGKMVSIKEVDTYSWHPSTQAPQVYDLWGCETNDQASNWTLLAVVDTRRQFGDAGGQYGVRIAADGDGMIGRYRYLGFNMRCTEDADPFGNTFYSEINVVDRDAHAGAAATTLRPKTETFSYDRQGVHLIFADDSAGFDPREKERLVDTFFAVYPRMAMEFNHGAPTVAKILLDPNFHGVAQTEGTTIRCNPMWFRDHPEDLDVITHEGMHVVQQYRQWEPTWIVEGIADYARAKIGINNAAGGWTMPEFDSKQSYQDAYRVTARFFVWLEKHVKSDIMMALDQTMREGKYAPEFWTQQTGKSVDELWADYGKNSGL